MERRQEVQGSIRTFEENKTGFLSSMESINTTLFQPITSGSNGEELELQDVTTGSKTVETSEKPCVRAKPRRAAKERDWGG